MPQVNKWMIDPKDAVMLLIDHQSGLFQLVKDIDMPTLRNNVIALAMPIDTFAVLGELMSTWNRPDAMEFAAVMIHHIVPHYRLLNESYDKAQNVQKVGRETKLDRLEAAPAKK